MTVSEGVKAADICLQILEFVAFEAQGAGVTQIAQAVGIAKSAVFKHLQTLIDRGFVAQDPATSRYRLGPKTWLLARNAPDLDDVAAIALPLMQAARNELGLAVVLSTPSPRSAYVVATVPSNHQIEIGVRAGSELTLHASAQGKIYLAFGPADALSRALAAPLPAITTRSVTDPARLAAEIAEVRRLGYAAAPEESLLGVNAIAAPIFNYEQRLVGSIGLIGSVQHITTPPDPQLVHRLLALTGDISNALGARPR
ncbi:IclR family transcriptional regulator [Frigidibacter oleivorans]|uniref:IclR family transcriptional regulator n=1 Tax=Frigidibacter oleivorans TaxID=2487129 RepID=UPI000F8CA18E|nr:IclR family transcriptional regulator [Frigidibacter oleivorans]